MEETKILNELTKHIPEKVAERVIYLIKLAKKNNIHILKQPITIRTTEGEQKYTIIVDLLYPEITIWETKTTRINLNNLTPEPIIIETEEQTEQDTTREPEILKELLNHIPKEQAERTLHLIKLAKENNITHLFTTLYEDDKQYTLLHYFPEKITIQIKEWSNRKDERTKITIPL